ncbi:HAD family hydrolase [Desulfurococcaceae archaeon MEX13E-LK6-19]|nr:HAD family hydrolase [Desulfurococcaceae archaeon MEX13E-LK6-19]
METEERLSTMILCDNTKLLLFDLDGTLVDTKDVIVKSFVLAAQKMGIKIDPKRVRELIGYPLMDVVKGSLLDNYDEETIDRFVRLRKSIMEQLWRKEAKLFSDVIPVLEALSKRKDVVLGIASSSIIERIIEMTKYFGIIKYFKILSGVHKGVRGKPHPDVLIYAMEKTGIQRECTVYIGDAEIDCITARNAGISFILINRDCCDVKTWKYKPDLVIHSLRDILSVI